MVQPATSPSACVPACRRSWLHPAIVLGACSGRGGDAVRSAHRGTFRSANRCAHGRSAAQTPSAAASRDGIGATHGRPLAASGAPSCEYEPGPGQQRQQRRGRPELLPAGRINVVVNAGYDADAFHAITKAFEDATGATVERLGTFPSTRSRRNTRP